MQKLLYAFLVCVAAGLVLGNSIALAQTTVDTWGFIGGRTGGWQFVPGAAGGAGVAGNQNLNGTWSAIRGEFAAPLTATVAQAVVITGQVEFTGAGPTTWSALRYGLFAHDSAGTLLNAGTDSAKWSGSEAFARGFMFTPHSGTNDQVGWGVGGNGTQGVVRNANWISSSSGGVNLSLGVVNQKPARAQMSAGVYNFAISVQPTSDTTKELRFYMVKTGTPVAYWFGGTVVDTTYIAPTFNGVCFALNGGNGAESNPIRGMTLTGVTAGLGDPITIPEAPWEAYYVDAWGFIGGRTGGWNFVPGSVIGNAGVAGNQNLNGTWSAIRAGFIDPIAPTETKALVVTGKMEFIGAGPRTWSGLRYGFFRHDSVGTLVKDTSISGGDSTHWNGKESNSYGYMFAPHSGVNDQAGWASGGNGTQGVIRGGTWLSTFGNAHRSLGVINQKPARAEMSAGTYDFAMSVQPLAGGGNEVRFFLVKTGTPVTYWYGGTVVDTEKITTSYNGVCFALNGGNGAESSPIRGMNLIDVKVDLGDPITIPEAPWQAYYLDAWGFIGGRTGGWNFVPGSIIGNAGMEGTAPNTDWAAMRGGFFDPVQPPAGKALQVTGKLILTGGGFQAANSLRFGLFQAGNPGVRVDSANSLTGRHPDSTRWTGGEDQHKGYLMVPPSGTNAPADWLGIPGTWGVIANDVWLNPGGPRNFPLGDNMQEPAGAVATAGTYDFSIVATPQKGGAYHIAYNLAKPDNSYRFSGALLQGASLVVTPVFNGVNFALGAGNTTTALKVEDMKVDLITATVDVEDPAGFLPTVFALNQNYPNPFNPSTTISYDLPEAAHVRIVIYDLLGRSVATLVDGVQPASRQHIVWNAGGVGTGVYFYRMEAKGVSGSGDFSAVKKLILMK